MGTISTVITWVAFGLVIGWIARALYPGPQRMGFLATIALGVTGSFVGGLISYLFGHHPEQGPFRSAGWIMSIIGALIVVWAGLHLGSRKASGTPPVA